jgi:hypothetical protein
MNSNSIAQVIANIRSAKGEIKALATAARSAAPKGQKMPHGQHATATAAAAVAAAIVPDITKSGWVASSVTVNKAGTDIAIHYRAPVTLEQRLATWQSAAAKRTAIREAKRAAKAAAAVKIEAKAPVTGTNVSELADLLAKLAKAA